MDVSFLMVLYVASLCVPVESWLCCFAVRGCLNKVLIIFRRKNEEVNEILQNSRFIIYTLHLMVLG
jgi:hypothetical protein